MTRWDPFRDGLLAKRVIRDPMEVHAWWSQQPNIEDLRQLNPRQNEGLLATTDLLLRRAAYALKVNADSKNPWPINDVVVYPRPKDKGDDTRYAYDETMERICELGSQITMDHVHPQNAWLLSTLRDRIAAYRAQVNSGGVPEGLRYPAKIDILDAAVKEPAKLIDDELLPTWRLPFDPPGALSWIQDEEVKGAFFTAQQSMIDGGYSPGPVTEGFVELAARRLELAAQKGERSDLDVDLGRVFQAMQDTDGAVLGRFLAASAKHPALAERILDEGHSWQGARIADLERLSSANPPPDVNGFTIPVRLRQLGTEQGPIQIYENAEEYAKEVGLGGKYRHNVLEFSDHAFARELQNLVISRVLPPQLDLVEPEELAKAVEAWTGALRAANYKDKIENDVGFTNVIQAGDFSWARNLEPTERNLTNVKTLLHMLQRLQPETYGKLKQSDIWVGGAEGVGRARNLAQARGMDRTSPFFNDKMVDEIEREVAGMPFMEDIAEIMADRKKLALRNAELVSAGLPPVRKKLGYLISGDAGTGKSLVAEILARYDIALGIKRGVVDPNDLEAGPIHFVYKKASDLFPHVEDRNGEHVEVDGFDLEGHTADNIAVIMDEVSDAVDSSEEKLVWSRFRNADGNDGATGFIKIFYKDVKDAMKSEGGGAARRAGLHVPRAAPNLEGLLEIGKYELREQNKARVARGLQPVKIWSEGARDSRDELIPRPARYVEPADLFAQAMKVDSWRGRADFGNADTIREEVSQAFTNFEDAEEAWKAAGGGQGSFRMTLEHLHGETMPVRSEAFEAALKRFKLNPYVSSDAARKLEAHLGLLIERNAHIYRGLVDNEKMGLFERELYNLGQMTVEQAQRAVKGRLGNPLPIFKIESNIEVDEMAIMEDLYPLLVHARQTRAKKVDPDDYAVLTSADGGSYASEFERFFEDKAKKHEALIVPSGIFGDPTAIKDGGKDPALKGLSHIAGMAARGELSTALFFIGPSRQLELLGGEGEVKSVLRRGASAVLSGLRRGQLMPYIQRRLQARMLPLEDGSTFTKVRETVTGQTLTPQRLIEDTLNRLYKVNNELLGAGTVDTFVDKIATHYNQRVHEYDGLLGEDGTPPITFEDVEAAEKDMNIVELPELKFWRDGVKGTVSRKLREINPMEKVARMEAEAVLEAKGRAARRVLLEELARLELLAAADLALPVNESKLKYFGFEQLDRGAQQAAIKLSGIGAKALGSMKGLELYDVLFNSMMRIESDQSKIKMMTNKLGASHDGLNMKDGRGGKGGRQTVKHYHLFGRTEAQQ
ncbi:MAG: hypothetical protein ACT4TC_14800 [Myxococcaceae bacterium]